MTPEDVDLIRSLARSRLDGRGMPNSKPGLWFRALEQIEALVGPKTDAVEIYATNTAPHPILYPNA